MILAGGKGERLRPLTRDRCKPAIFFGASLRVIDFTLFNCFTSGIRSIFVLTQYRSESLHDHLEARWRPVARVSRRDLGVLPASTCGPPREYLGTAHAVHQNRRVIEELHPDHVLVLSGDHVYRADYQKFLDHHLDCNADVTLLTEEVQAREASAFGVVSTRWDGRVLRFVEKPADASPYSLGGKCSINLGVYLFRSRYLLETLLSDSRALESSHDFGRDLLPLSVHRGRTFACPIRNITPDETPYWRDVGTIDSLFESHMDLVSDPAVFQLEDPRWSTNSRFRAWLPHHLPSPLCRGRCTCEGRCLVAATADIVGARLSRSVIGPEAHVDRGACLEECVVFPGAVIGEGARLCRVIVEEGVRVPAGEHIAPGEPGPHRCASSSGVTVVARGPRAPADHPRRARAT